MTCRNCGAGNAAGATHCHACRMPGDFGQAPATAARVAEAPVRACGNCAADVPVAAARCARCRWPQPPPQDSPSPTPARETLHLSLLA